MTHAPTTPTGIPTPEREPHRRPAPGRLFGLMAEFETPRDLLHAAERVHKAGYRWWDCHTPFPVHGLDRAMGISPTILPVVVFLCGLTGTMLGLAIQIFTNATDFDLFGIVTWVRGYPFMVSGKPLISLPAFIPVTFELTILLAAAGATFGMLIMNGLPRLFHPVFRSERFARASDDRFFIVIEARDPRFSPRRTEEFLASLRPASVEALES
jgi:hypothetical protein